MLITLDALPQGSTASVCSERAEGSLRRRLLDFGLIEGTEILCLRCARGISLYKLRGTMLALRKADGAKICVELCV